VRFSVRVNNDLPFADLLALAGVAEQAGFDQLWFSNDLFLRSAPVLAGALAVRTGRIGLGIAVMNPYSVHVSELAMAAATAQEVSGGRFLLGLGAGAEQFLGWAGLARPRPLAVTRTALVALRALLGHEDVDRTLLPEWFGPDSVLRFPLERPVPVYVGAMGPKMLELAGRHADGVLPLLYPPERYATVRPQVLAGAALDGAGLDGAGLDGGSRSRDVDLPACFWVSVSDDAAAARAALAEKLAYYGPSIPAAVLAGSGLRPQDFAPAAELAHGGRGAAALIDDRMLSLGVAGDGADVLARCRALTRLGASHLSFGPPLGPDPVAAVRLLGEQVLPALQEVVT
jgi:5,10-methylenetetrahydromethanopterin reductase